MDWAVRDNAPQTMICSFIFPSISVLIHKADIVRAVSLQPETEMEGDRGRQREAGGETEGEREIPKERETEREEAREGARDGERERKRDREGEGNALY